MIEQPNVIVLLPDQLRALSLPLFGEKQISTPSLDQLAKEGLTLTNAISNCPVCTPARAMLVTGRYPQTTGHLINTTRTRHSELSIADAFSHAGYKTAWIGKWHLHTGLWPAIDRMPQHPDWVPEGRDRLGFSYWRAYNQHMVYFDGFVHKDDWNYERWEGYETNGLFKYACDFLDECDDKPFLMFLSPHQPHYTPFKFAPEHFYKKLPAKLELPANVPSNKLKSAFEMYRHYLAMILAIDEMLGRLMNQLENRGIADNTILVVTSDHGTQAGSQGINPWSKKNPYEGSIRVPGFIRYPGKIESGSTCNTVFSLVDWFPTLCELSGIPIPRSIEGVSRALDVLCPLKESDTTNDAFIMNFSKYFDWFQNGAEWRGVRTSTHTYSRWLDGREELYDLVNDPLQIHNIIKTAETPLLNGLKERLALHQAKRCDELLPCTAWKGWLDEQRRVVRNAFGELSHPESLPDFSLLH